MDERKWRYGKVELENIWKKCILEIRERFEFSKSKKDEYPVLIHSQPNQK